MTTTRRTVLSGISTGLASLPALAVLPTSVAPQGDGELLKLGRQFAPLTAHLATAKESLLGLLDRVERDGPQPPEVLRPQVGDHRIGLHPRFVAGHLVPFYDADQINYIRGRQFGVSQSRADEIVTAYDEWHRDQEGFKDKIGLAVAEKAFNQSVGDVNAIEEAILATPATTPEGIDVIAAVVLWEYQTHGSQEFFAKIAGHLAQCIGAPTPSPTLAPAVLS
jgi:hypothetical protein